MQLILYFEIGLLLILNVHCMIYFFSMQLIFFILLNTIINIRYFLSYVYVLKLLPKFNKLLFQSLHELAECVLYSLLELKHLVCVNSLHFMKLFYKFLIWNYLTFLISMSTTRLTSKWIINTTWGWNTYILTFVTITYAFWI